MKTKILLFASLLALAGAGCAPASQPTAQPTPAQEEPAIVDQQASPSIQPDAEMPAEFQDHLDAAVDELNAAQ